MTIIGVFIFTRIRKKGMANGRSIKMIKVIVHSTYIRTVGLRYRGSSAYAVSETLEKEPCKQKTVLFRKPCF